MTSGAIADLDPDAASRGLSSDVIAGVLQRFDGSVPGTALFVLDPGDALLWLQREGASEAPLDHFVAWGGELLAGVVGPLGAALETPITQGTPVLEERPLMAALLATHAPSDTIVISIQGELVFGVPGVDEQMHAPFSIHLLLEPKFVGRILHALTGDTHPDTR